MRTPKSSPLAQKALATAMRNLGVKQEDKSLINLANRIEPTPQTIQEAEDADAIAPPVESGKMRATVPAERPKGGVPQQYNHEEGLKTIVVAEAAEKYFARAKNLDGLSKAIKDKLEAQRDFALWWDGLGEKRGSGPAKRCNGSDTSLPIAGQAGLPSRQVIQRWRPLEDPDNFNDALDAALEKARQLCEGDKHIRGTFSTRNYEWYTPAEFMAPVRSVLGSIDLDPASSDIAQETIGAKQYFTQADDGLTREWQGRVFMNPPYSQPEIQHFADKLTTEWRAGRVTEAIVLANSYTDTRWFHQLASCASAICFTLGRISFVSQKGDIAAPIQGNAFFYLGNEPDKFAKEFEVIGLIARLKYEAPD